jgi:hypothetical protein
MDEEKESAFTELEVEGNITNFTANNLTPAASYRFQSKDRQCNNSYSF